MSSVVQAKCTNSSAGPSSASSFRRSLMKYSTALTSWLVVRSISLTRAASATEKLVGERAQACGGGLGERRELDDARLVGQRQQPFDLDLHARLDQAVLGEDRAQRIDLAGIAAIERGQGEQRGVRGHGEAWGDGEARDSIRLRRDASRRPASARMPVGVSCHPPAGDRDGSSRMTRVPHRARQHGRAAACPPMRCGARRPSARCRTSRSPAGRCRASSSARWA